MDFKDEHQMLGQTKKGGLNKRTSFGHTMNHSHTDENGVSNQSQMDFKVERQMLGQKKKTFFCHNTMNHSQTDENGVSDKGPMDFKDER